MRVVTTLIALTVGFTTAVVAADLLEPTFSVLPYGLPANPAIIGTTNLPDGTALLITIENKETQYLEQGKVIVQGGGFNLQIARDGRLLPAGTYTVNVLLRSGSIQPDTVSAIIGYDGRQLTGPLVREETNGVSASYSSSFTVTGHIGRSERESWQASATKNLRTAVSLKAHGGIFVVPVEINGAMRLDFAIDSGAADVIVPADVFSTLRRGGTIKESELIGQRTYILADGSKLQSATFTIRSLKVGDIVVQNVRGSVAPVQGNLLLGQSFLERFKSWSIDNRKHELLLEPQ
jgi:clan AA aspartic protease (TIGR02281 family)